MKIMAAAALLALALAPGAARGVDPPASYGDAMRWYERAAEAGDAKAQFLLGRLYERGAGGRGRDPARAAALYRKAAEQGHALAQLALALLYQRGEGVEKDPARAARWLEAAAQQGLREAQFNLGWLYDHGIGVAPDRETAERWYRAAAEQGLRQAMVNLALVLVAAGPEDRPARTEAWAWLTLAAARGANGVQPMADDLGAKLSAEEMASARAALATLEAQVPER